MKLHLMPRKLIINKITSVKAITDNNCVKEVLRCVWSRGGRRLNGHSALFPWDGPPKDKELGQTKTLLDRFWKLFFCFSWCLILPCCSSQCRNKQKKTTSASKHGFIMSAVQTDENAPAFLVRTRSHSKTSSSVIPFKV